MVDSHTAPPQHLREVMHRRQHQYDFPLVVLDVSVFFERLHHKDLAGHANDRRKRRTSLSAVRLAVDWRYMITRVQAKRASQEPTVSVCLELVEDGK